jgi:small subunit ribosomal protein S13
MTFFYIFETDLHLKKSIFFSLVSIFGIGRFNSFLICKQLGFAKNFKTKYLSKEQINQIIEIIEFLNFKVGNQLKKSKVLITKKLILIKCYKGLRKIKGLPVRGQRTHTNSRTARKIINKWFLFI